MLVFCVTGHFGSSVVRRLRADVRDFPFDERDFGTAVDVPDRSGFEVNDFDGVGVLVARLFIKLPHAPISEHISFFIFHGQIIPEAPYTRLGTPARAHVGGGLSSPLSGVGRLRGRRGVPGRLLRIGR